MIIRKLNERYGKLGIQSGRLLSIGILLIPLLISFWLLTPLDVKAQNLETYAESCGNAGEEKAINHFTCQVDGVSNWSTSTNSEMFCQPGYEINNTICTGSFPAIRISGNSHSVCVPCVLSTPEEPELYYGEACGSGIDGKCTNGTECRNNLCLRPQNVPFFKPCLDTSECIQGTSDHPGEAIVCREVEGTKKCAYIEGKFCSTDEECQEKTGNSEATCDATGLCINPPIISEEEIIPGVPYDYCAQVPGKIEIKKEEGKETEIKAEKGSQYEACQKCMGRFNPETGEYPNEGQKIYTAVGCISVDGKGFATDLIKLLLGVGGMATLLSILAASFIYTTSRGDSGKIKEAKDLITSAVTGLLFIIFSIVMLEYIGVQVLHIPGLGGGGTAPTTSKTDPLPTPTVEAVPGTLPPGSACSADYQCNQDSLTQCLDGTCQPLFRLVETCMYRPNPDGYCQEITGNNDATCFEYFSGHGLCVLKEDVEELLKPYNSVPLGGSCTYSLECEQEYNFDGVTHIITPSCIDNKCTVTSIGTSIACHLQANPNEYCQSALESSQAYCQELSADPVNGSERSKCVRPPTKPESVTCSNNDECNQRFNVRSGYECVFPGGGFTYPSGVTIGHCRQQQ